MTISFSNLPTRVSPCRRNCIRAAAHLAQTTVPSTQPFATAAEAMLGRANKDYEANATPSRPAFLKQSIPSSSPTANGDIRQFKTPVSGTLNSTANIKASAAARTGHHSFANPLHDRSANLTHPGASRLASKPSMASLYGGHSASFKDDAGVIDLTGAEAKAKIQQAVFFDEDDFSDDENLDLDFEAPGVLPTIQQPKPVVSQQMPPPPSTSQHKPPPATPGETIPWSSSPASHFLPPKPERASSNLSNGSSHPLKRESIGGDDDCVEVPPPKKVKKRVLPASFKQNETIQDDAAAKTPMSKSRGFWDPSASAVKEQRKQLKNSRQTKTGVDASDVPDDYKPKPAPAQAINLSSEQEHVLDLVVNQGRSVFFTGPAGTGKSVLMRAIIKKLKERHARDPERVCVTASTGLAACNIGGTTLHSFSGIGLGKEEAPELVKKIRRNPKAKGRWLKCKVLVIDEVSMVDGDLFDKLSQIGRTIRNNGRPWGGIQLVITGDFFQLPPVPDHGGGREVKFAFDANTWQTSIDHTIGLTQVFRQRDPEFANMLNEMRLGRITDATVAAFRALSRPLKFDDGVDLAELYPTRMQVENSNQNRLRALPGAIQRYEAMDIGKDDVRDKLLANVMAPKALDLKLNAQVMLIKNLDESLVNGSLGKVVGFSDEKTWSMGDDGDFDKDDTAMSKARAKLAAFSRDGSPAVSDGKKWPVVQFSATDGSTRTILCQPEDWKVELPNGEVQAKRSQLPLILAWALSIHKAQGQTLERVTVNLGKIFEKGQAYVALSRATSQAGLQVLGFERSKVMAHPKVISFYDKLYTAEEAVGRKPVKMADFANSRKGAPPALAKGQSTLFKTGPTEKKVVRSIATDEEEAMAAAWS